MATFTNPLASLGGFQNQQLARFTGGASPLVQGQQTSQQSSPVGDASMAFSNTRDRASRQHEMYLQALQANKQRQAASNVQPSYSRGGGGAMGGRYNLAAGADRALQAMNAAYRQQFGKDLVVNAGGRTRERQQYLYDLYRAGKGNLAAKPGTSVHESGRAVDFGGPIQNASSREHRWLQQNAGRWGFRWTGKNFKQFEPWHWEWS